jgi:hypothetical protein
MKIITVSRLRNASHESMQELLAVFGKMGMPEGMSAWGSIDGTTVFSLYEGDDLALLHKMNSRLSPYFERGELHVVLDAEESIRLVNEASSPAG